MAGTLTTAGKNAMLDAGASWPPAYLALHSVDAPTDGTSELSGGSPAYARKSASWSAASGGSKALSASPSFDVPAGATVKGLAAWSASTGGTLLATFDIVDEGPYGAQGTYAVTAATVSL